MPKPSSPALKRGNTTILPRRSTLSVGGFDNTKSVTQLGIDTQSGLTAADDQFILPIRVETV